MDLVQYYQWILGNMCKDDESVLLLFKIVMSNDLSEIKNAMNQTETLDKSDEDFGSDRSVLTYCEVKVNLISQFHFVQFFIKY